ncbi:glycosyltransferase involved in cell wall biosynthesis [Phyllobacterium ifriqiyense]|uniref:Glycosyltransferase involved in cell wall biosynthesis n=1 Tax=Phyllobacterium ifriqiyense TaxID=314238 RepID=A0ABU0S3Q3_9HYPH|nr:glycosyltransferase family 2 protein [Phyllobacterium ifriqiyense]MDQ0995389.1 glycosyltransferase involved in cell wall biosynthesis [Phyllobacterium ifriqiyense]
MKKMPLVAVVTPTYNGSRYLAETLASVQEQTWPNLVHVVLDNNSGDNTAAIVDSFRAGKVPILYARNEITLAQRENWNKAFSLVPDNSEYVRLLCDDDTIYPTSIEKMVNLAEQDKNIGVVGSYDDGHLKDFRWPVQREIFDGSEALARALTGRGVIMPIQMMWRRSIVEQRAPLFDHSIIGGAFDMDTVFDLLTRSKFGFVHESLGFTRAHPDSVSNLVYGPNTHSNTRDHFDLLLKYGQTALSAQYRETLVHFRRIYVRQIMLWWWKDAGIADIKSHISALKRGGFDFGPMLVIDALLDWLLRKFSLRTHCQAGFAPPQSITGKLNS